MSNPKEIKKRMLELRMNGAQPKHIISKCMNEFEITEDQAQEIIQLMTHERKSLKPAYQKRGFFKCWECQTEIGRFIETARNGKEQPLKEWVCMSCFIGMFKKIEKYLEGEHGK